MLSPSALIGDGAIGGGPHTGILDRKFENQGIVCAFAGARRTFWRPVGFALPIARRATSPLRLSC